MKRFFISVLSVTLMTLGVTQQGNAQDLSYGFKVEANMSNFFLSDLDAQTSTMKVGPNLGGFMKIELHENFAIQPEMIFYFRNSKMETEVGGVKSKDDFQQWGMQIPIYAVGQMELGNGKGYIGVGPYVGFGFDAKYDDADRDLYKEYNGKKDMNRWDFGAGVMLGYEFENGLQINAGYQMGFIDQLDRGKDDATMRTQTVSLGVGYRF
jgi:hypothetical protein